MQGEEKDPKNKENSEIAPEVITVKIPDDGEKKESSEDMKKHKEKKKTDKTFPSKKFLIILGACLLVFGSGAGIGLYYLLKNNESASDLVSSVIEQKEEKAVTYSNLTGLPLSDPSLVNAPAFCIQIPNGTDGARPQAGLSEAGVIFEAIAEAGITRFAAVFQNPTSSVIGPIRSLRMYYLNWDTPFDCTITHAGGADDALAAVRSGGYKDLTENYTYMWRGQTGTSVNRRWNNLFTSGDLLKQANNTPSNIKGFKRETPESAEKARISNLVKNPLDIDTATSGSVKEVTPKVTKISLDYASTASFNVIYTYNSENNTYARGYASGNPHVTYNCQGNLGNATPELACGEPTQLSPKVVIAMVVQEKRASDNYHEDITAIGSGKAYIFQNGDVTEGTWIKDDRASQIVFKDAAGAEISLVPGQTWISAIPNYGSINYE